MTLLQMHCMEVHTFERRPSKPYIWRSTTLKFHTLVIPSLFAFVFVLSLGEDGHYI